MLLRCHTPAMIVFVPFGSAYCREASRKLDFCFTQQLSKSLCSTVNPSRSKIEFRKCVSSPLWEETNKNRFRADVVNVRCFGLFTDLVKVHQRCFLYEHLHKRQNWHTRRYNTAGFFVWHGIVHWIFAPKNFSAICMMDFETQRVKIGGVGVDDVNCQSVTLIQKCCMKSLQSLFSLVPGAHITTGLWIHRSHNAFVLAKLPACRFVARILRSFLFHRLERKKRDSSQSRPSLMHRIFQLRSTLLVLNNTFMFNMRRCNLH